MFLNQQNAVTMLAESPREVSADGSCTDDYDVILGNHVITPRTRVLQFSPSLGPDSLLENVNQTTGVHLCEGIDGFATN